MAVPTLGRRAIETIANRYVQRARGRRPAVTADELRDLVNVLYDIVRDDAK